MLPNIVTVPPCMLSVPLLIADVLGGGDRQIAADGDFQRLLLLLTAILVATVAVLKILRVKAVPLLISKVTLLATCSLRFMVPPLAVTVPAPALRLALMLPAPFKNVLGPDRVMVPAFMVPPKEKETSSTSSDSGIGLVRRSTAPTSTIGRSARYLWRQQRRTAERVRQLENQDEKMSERERVTLEFLACQQDRMLAELASLRDDVNVLTAIVQRIDSSLTRLLTEIRATHSQASRPGERRRRLESWRRRKTNDPVALHMQGSDGEIRWNNDRTRQLDG
jgi:hypothetical protein